MLTVTGRPRKACGTCKAQKIRCSGERPSCKRCARLNHTCTYETPPTGPRLDPERPPRPTCNKRRAPITPPATRREGFVIGSSSGNSTNEQPIFPSLTQQPDFDERYLGIPKALLSTLIDLYFDNVYNTSLLLQKKSFQQSVAAGTARAHVVLSICAWGAR